MKHYINAKQNLGAHEEHVGCMQGATVTVFITTFFLMMYTQEVFSLSKGHVFYTSLLLSKGRGQITLQAGLSRQPEDRVQSKGYRIPKTFFGFSQVFLSNSFCWVVLVNLSNLVARTLGTGLVTKKVWSLTECLCLFYMEKMYTLKQN